MKTNPFKLLLLAFSLVGITFFSSCDEESMDELEDVLGYSFGLTNFNDTSTIENDLYLGSGNGEVPASADLSSQFPPIGNQGSYGTCVAWAVGYNLRTFLYKVDNPNADLSSSGNQMSAKDLFWSIPDSDKGSSCNGTNFEPAFDAMINRGIASLSSVPYSDLGACTYNPISGTDAGDHKLAAYRQIAIDKDVLKSYLANGRAIAIGARLGDNFMAWNSDAVLDYDTYNDPNMQHAYHAMTLCGYDDNKGANGAFKVVNSWGTTWGANGYIWVDYDFFINNTGEFCFAAFVADSENSDPDPDGDQDPDQTVTGIDLAAWELADAEYDPNDLLHRVITYNVYNIGTNAISASTDWNILYIYYNAYDANDYGIILYDYYSDDYGSYGEDGDINDVGGTTYGSSGNWYNHIDIPADVSVVEALTGQPTSSFEWPYYMPEITGTYYLVLVADGFDVVEEPDETNNYYYLTDAYGDPLEFVDGIMQTPTKNSGNKTKLSNHRTASLNRQAFRNVNKNSYTPKEIYQLLQYQKNSGRLAQKVQQYVQRTKGQSGAKTTR